MLSVYAQDHVAFSPCSNYSDSFSYISFPYAFPLHKDYGQDGADDDDDEVRRGVAFLQDARLFTGYV